MSVRERWRRYGREMRHWLQEIFGARLVVLVAPTTSTPTWRLGGTSERSPHDSKFKKSTIMTSGTYHDVDLPLNGDGNVESHLPSPKPLFCFLESAREMASVGIGGFYRQKKRGGGGVAKPNPKRSSTGKSAAIALSFTDPDQSPVLGTLSSPQFFLLCFTLVTDLVHLQPAGRGYCGAREDSVGGGIRGGEAAAVRSGHAVWPLPGTQPDGAVGPGCRHGAEPAG
ncbi:hypothetical protein BHE74_00025739 [Ensete ventricosum]|nr:hypothetical protein BHE74_00025739 [Ensete ventricosum]